VLCFLHEYYCEGQCCPSTRNTHCTTQRLHFDTHQPIPAQHASSTVTLPPLSTITSLIATIDTCTLTIHRPVIKVGDVYDMLKNVQHHCFPIGTYVTEWYNCQPSFNPCTYALRYIPATFMVVSLRFFLNYSSRIHLRCISFEHVIHSLHVEASYLSLPIACMGGFMHVSVPILYPMHPFSYSFSSLSSLSTFILPISPLPAYFCPFFYFCPLALFCVLRVHFFCQHP
jgi:hypothetical protein